MATPSPRPHHLNIESSLTKNASLNIIGTLLPIPAAIIAIPLLINYLGTERFGVLTIAWMIVGYFNLFDFGLSRALVKLLSEKIGLGKHDEVLPLIWTTSVCLGALGLVAALLFSLLSPILVRNILNIPAELQQDALQAFYILAASVPIVVTNTALRGILESYQRFDVVNAVRIPLGIFNYLGPLLILPFRQELVPVVLVLALGRIIVWFVYVGLCARAIPGFRWRVEFRMSVAKDLFKFGSWMTLSNIIGPLMVYFDRIFIGMYLSMTAVAYYTTPYEVATKLWLITGALMPVLFPAFSAAIAAERDAAARIFNRGTNYMFLLLFPPTLLIILFAYEGLTWWINVEFAQHSTIVLQLIAVGVFVNSIAQVFFAVIQGCGRPDLTAKVHLMELPLYMVALWFGVTKFGLVGAAVAWTVRVALDGLALGLFTNRLLPEAKGHVRGVSVQVLIYGSLLCVGLFFHGPIWVKCLFFGTLVTLFYTVFGKFILTREDKAGLQGLLTHLRSRLRVVGKEER